MRLRRLALTVLIAVTALPVSGCVLRFLLGFEIAQTLSEEIERIVSAIRTGATTSVCQGDPFFSPNFVRCTYFIEGVEVASTTTLLREGGPFGAIVDPVVLELPATATNVRGTYADGDGNTGDLVVYAGLLVVPVDDTRVLRPGSGKQLVIVDLPSGVPVDGVDYDFAFDFEQILPAGSAPTEVKALFTGKAQLNGKTFYPPLYPCTTDLASLPTLALPRATTPQPLDLPDDLPVCNNQFYTYFRADSEFRPCDLDNDHVVDRDDLALIMAVRNTSTSPGDPRDANDNGRIDANDARACANSCDKPRCAP